MFWKHAKTIFYFFSIFFVQKVCVPNLWNLEVSSKIYAKINSSPLKTLPEGILIHLLVKMKLRSSVTIRYFSM